MAAEQQIATVRLALDLLIREMVDEPEQVSITPLRNDDGSVVFYVKVAPNDVGKVIGKQGRNARSLRTILCAASQSWKKAFGLDIEEASGIGRGSVLDSGEGGRYDDLGRGVQVSS